MELVEIHVFHSDIYTKSNFISYLAPKMYLYFLIEKKVGQNVQFFWILWIRQVTLRYDPIIAK